MRFEGDQTLGRFVTDDAHRAVGTFDFYDYASSKNVIQRAEKFGS
jgi:hypothetical protein